MNKEALYLIVAITIPVILVFLILLYLQGYDITLFFRKINPIYYVVICPVLLGLLAAVLWWKEAR